MRSDTIPIAAILGLVVGYFFAVPVLLVISIVGGYFAIRHWERRTVSTWPVEITTCAGVLVMWLTWLVVGIVSEDFGNTIADLFSAYVFR